MSPERVSVGEEGEGHSMQKGRTQKRCWNQHRLVQGICRMRISEAEWRVEDGV